MSVGLLIGRLWISWIQLLKRQEDALSLALVRVGVGLVVLEDLFSTWSSGALPLIWGDLKDTPEGFRVIHSERLSWLGGHYQQVTMLSAVTVLMALLLVLGVAARFSAFFCLQGCITLYQLNPAAGGGHDRVITNALWLLVLADSGRTLSVSARWRTGQWRDPAPVAAWPRYLMVGQLILMYTATGLQKLSPEWFPWGGWQAVYNMLLVPAWARFDLAPVLGRLGPLTQLSTACTWAWESSFWMVGVWLLQRGLDRPGHLRRLDLRSLYAMLGLSFHLGLLILTDLGPFSLICLSLYPSLYHPDELRRGWNRLWRRPVVPQKPSRDAEMSPRLQ